MGEVSGEDSSSETQNQSRKVGVKRERWRKVAELKPIVGTAFPDIELIRLAGSATEFPAEVKFTTSLFDYHKKDSSRFKIFRDRGGALIVLSHDYIPSGLERHEIDVYEIDQVDFTTFCRARARHFC